MFTSCTLSVALHGTICMIRHFSSAFCVQRDAGNSDSVLLLIMPPLHLVKGVNKQKPITQTHSLPRCMQRAVKRQVKLLRTLELLADCKKKKKKGGQSASAPVSTQPSASLEFPLEVTFPSPRGTH